jgi:dihydroorotase (homodimeric type)
VELYLACLIALTRKRKRLDFQFSTANSVDINRKRLSVALKKVMIQLHQPDDFHHHLRDGDVLDDVVQLAAKQFRSVIVMPNLKPPIRTVSDANAYRHRILSCTSESFPDFNPLMTLYLTDNTSVEEIEDAKSSGFIHAVKYYPAGATTNSEFGVTSLDRVEAVLQVHSLCCFTCVSLIISDFPLF